MNMRTTFGALALAAVVLLPACSTSPGYGEDIGQVDAQDRDFLVQATQANLTEIQLGRLAEDKGSTRTVRDFGNRMVQDHTSVLEEIRDLADNLDVDLPTEPAEAQKQQIAQLEELEGQEFDRQYGNLMVQNHERSVALFERNSTQARHADLREFASDTLPTLRHHLEMARELNTKVTAPSMY